MCIALSASVNIPYYRLCTLCCNGVDSQLDRQLNYHFTLLQIYSIKMMLKVSIQALVDASLCSTVINLRGEKKYIHKWLSIIFLTSSLLLSYSIFLHFEQSELTNQTCKHNWLFGKTSRGLMTVMLHVVCIFYADW